MMLAIFLVVALFLLAVLFMAALRQADEADEMYADYYVGDQAAHPLPDTNTRKLEGWDR
jgi:hypothetical protein